MNENIDNEELLKGYTKYLRVKAQMELANKKYRASEHGQIQSKINHKNWFESKKSDMEYKKIVNEKAKARYHIRKTKKMLEKYFLEEKFDESLGEKKN
jgi:hypothetical protein